MDKWNFLVIPNGNDRTTNPAHKLYARQRHSVAANTPVRKMSVARRPNRPVPRPLRTLGLLDLKAALMSQPIKKERLSC